jgi:hypothetical protein
MIRLFKVFKVFKMTDKGTLDSHYSWKICDDGPGSSPRIEYFDDAGSDVTPMPLYIPEASVVAAVEKNKMK